MPRRSVLLAVATAAAALLVACSGGDDGASTVAAAVRTPPPSAAPDGPLALGEEWQAGDLRITIEGYRLDTLGALVGPAEGNVFLVATVRATNEGPVSYALARAFQFEAGGSEGDGIYRVSNRARERGTLNVVVPPGAVVRGEVGFEVLAAAGPYRVTFVPKYPAQSVTWDLPAAAAGRPASPRTEDSPPGTLALSDQVRLGDAVITVEGFRVTREGTPGPARGNSYIVATVVVENRGGGPYRWSLGQQIYARDSFGFSYRPTSSAALDAIADLVAAGDRVRGEVAFDLPDTAAPYQITFKSAAGDEIAVWRLE